MAPGLRHDPERTYVAYHDHQTDDARLVLAALRTAEIMGAVWLNYARVEGLRITGGTVAGADVVDLVSGEGFAISARAVVNATGPWVDHLRRLESPSAAASVRLSKGAHLVLECSEPWHAAVTSPLPEGRVSFAIPWHGMLLLGTTDEPFEGDPATVQPTEADRAQILAEAADVARPGRHRPLPCPLRVRGTPRPAPRRHVDCRNPPGDRRHRGQGRDDQRRRWQAHDVAAHRSRRRHPGARVDRWTCTRIANRLRSSARPIRMWCVVELLRRCPELPEGSAAHLAGLYGTLAYDVLEPAVAEPELLEPIVPGGPDVLAQARYAVEHEAAVTADDILRRTDDRGTPRLRGRGPRARRAFPSPGHLPEPSGLHRTLPS